ncbi:unnamed protein product, partial [Staurois parvus]
QFNSVTIAYDISLIKLSSPTTFTDRISPRYVLLPSMRSSMQEKDASPPGWGQTNGAIQNGSTKLQQASLPLLAITDCQRYWGSRIQPTMICAGASGVSSCQGDAGGPLVCQRNGAGPWPVSCPGKFPCSVYSPVVYSRITALRSWLDQTVAAY